MLLRARPVAQYLVAKKLEVGFPLPGRSGRARPVRLGHHRDDPTSTANRLVSGDLHFESLKRSPNVVLGDVVRGGFLGEVADQVLRQTRWQIFRHVAMVVGVDTGLTALHRNAPPIIRAGHVGG